MAERIPPQDVDSEMALLGAMMLYADGRDNRGDPLSWTIDEVQAILTTADVFYGSGHRVVYKAIIDTYEAGEPIEFTSVLPRLCAAEGFAKYWTDRADAQGYCIQLAESFADIANALYYARKVRQCYQLRAIIRACDLAESDAYNSPVADAGDIVASLSGKLERIDGMTIGDHDAVMESALLRSLPDPASVTRDIVPVGLGTLGRLLGGGFARGTLTIVGARPSSGKTSLGLGLCQFASGASGGCPALFVSVEQTSVQVGQRLLAMRANMPLDRMLSGAIDSSEFNRARNEAALNSQTEKGVYVLDKVDDVRAIAGHIRRMTTKHNIGLVVVDYLGLLNTSERFEDRPDLRIALMTRMFKVLSVDLNIAIVVLSQLNRKSVIENRQPRLSDLRDSGAIEQDADYALLINKLQGEGHVGDVAETEIIVAKNRATGRTGVARVGYHKPTLRYAGLSYDSPSTEVSL